jgi:hypothetical protein
MLSLDNFGLRSALSAATRDFNCMPAAARSRRSIRQWRPAPSIRVFEIKEALAVGGFWYCRT